MALAQTPAPNPSAILKGHTETIYSVAASRDGKFIATGSFDKTVKLWGITGKELRTFAGKGGHTNLVIAVAFNAQGNQLASASTDNTVKLWDIANGTPSSTLEQPANVSQVASSPDGKLIAAALADGSITLWTSADNKLKFTFKGHVGAISAIGFSNNGQALYSLGLDKTLRYWNTADGKETANIGVAFAEHRSFSVHPGTNQVYITSADGSARVWPNAVTMPKDVPNLPAVPLIVGFSADGNLAAYATVEKKLQTINTLTGKPGPAFEPLPGVVKALAVAQTGSLFLAGNTDGMAYVYAADGKLKGSFRAHAGSTTDVAFVPNNTQFYTAGSDGFVRAWATAPDAPKIVAHPDRILSTMLLSDGKKLATGCADKLIRICTDGKIEKTFTGHTTGVSAIEDGSGGTLISGDESGAIFSWNVNDGKKTAAEPAGPKLGISAILRQPGTAGFAVVYTNGEVVLRPVLVAKEKEKTHESKSLAHPAPVLASAFTPDGKKLYTISTDKNLRTWNLDTAKAEATVPLTTGALKQALFTADRTKLVLAVNENGKNKLLLRALAGDGKPTWEAPIVGEPEAMAISANASRIAVAVVNGASRSVLSFDALLGRELQILAEPKARVRGLAFQNDNKTVLIAGEDKNLLQTELAVTAAQNVGAGNANAMAIHPTTGHIYVVGTDKIVRVWDMKKQPEVTDFGTLATPGTHIAISRDGTTLAAGSGKAFQCWTIADKKALPIPPLPADVVSLSFGPDKTKLLLGLANNTVATYDITGARFEQFAKHATPIIGANFHSQLQYFTSIAQDKTIVNTPNAIVRAFTDPQVVGTCAELTQNGSYLLCAGTGPGFFGLNTSNMTKEKTFAIPGAVSAVAAAKNNAILAAAHGNEISILNTSDGSLVGKFPVPAKVVELAFHPGNQAIAARTQDGKLFAYGIAFDAGQPLPPEFGKLIQDFPHATPVRSFQFVTDGGTLLSATDDKLIRFWKFASELPSESLTHPNRADAIAFDKTGTLLATGCADGNLRIWDVSKPKPTAIKTIQAHIKDQPAEQNPIYGIAWSPDSKEIATASFDKSIKIWNATDGKLIRELKPGPDRAPLPPEVRAIYPAVVGTSAGLSITEPPIAGHTDHVYTIAYSPDGKFLASGSSDRNVKLWDAKTGALLRTFENSTLKLSGDGAKPSHPGFVQTVIFSADSSKIVSAGPAPRNMGYLAVWNVADGKMLAAHEMPVGAIYCADLLANGSIIIGCGAKERGQTESEALILPINVK